MKKKEKKFWVRCEPEQYKKLQEMAEKEELSLGQLVLTKLLNLKIDYQDEIKEYLLYKNTKQGKKEYKSRYVSRKKILIPAEPVLA